MIDELEDDIKNLKRNKNSNYKNKNSYYYDYHNTGNYFDSWYENLPYRNYYKDNSYYYNTRSYNRRDQGYYYYDNSFGWTYKPGWVNPDLEKVKDGRVYIR